VKAVRDRVEDTTKEAAGFEGDERWELAQRIVSSRTFAKSRQLQAFLIYVTKQTIRGRLDEINEQTIGSQVLGRRPDYDPAEDNIVRVRARQLRQKIGQYFAGEGANEILILSMPTGSYVPIFEKRILEPAVMVVHGETVTDLLPRPNTGTAWLPWMLAGIFAVASLVLWFELRGSIGRSQLETPPQNVHQFWSQIFTKKGEDVLLVMGDSGFALWQDLTRRNLTLADYLRGAFRRPVEGGDLDVSEVASRRYTSLADVNFVTRLLPVSRSFGSHLKVRFARHIDIRDLKTGNIILLGSRRANPWVEIFEPHIHYAYGYDVEARRSFFRNAAPRPGEPGIFARNNNGASRGESYGLVALLPNMNASGKVLLVEGLNMEGTDAAGEFLLNAQTCQVLIQRLQHEIGFPGQFFEALLKLTPLEGSSANVQLVSVRRPSL